MRHAGSCLIAVCLLAVPVFAQSNATPAGSKTAASLQEDFKQIRQIEDDWLNGEKTTDIRVLERVLSDEYVNLTPRGIGPGKAEILEHLRPKAGQAPPYTLETHDMHIYILGDTAVAAYAKSYTANANGNVVHEDTTHIFTKDHGVWKLRISRATIPENPPSTGQ